MKLLGSAAPTRSQPKILATWRGPKTVTFEPAPEQRSFTQTTTVYVLIDGERVGRVLSHGAGTGYRTYLADTAQGHFPDGFGGTVRNRRFYPEEDPEEYLTNRLQQEGA